MFIWGHRIKHLIIIQYCHSSYLGTEFMLFVVRLGELNVFEHMPPPCGLSRIMQTHSQMCLVHWCSVEAITANIIVLYLCDFSNSIPKEKVPRRCWNTIFSSHKTGWDLFVWKWNSFIYTLKWHDILCFGCKGCKPLIFLMCLNNSVLLSKHFNCFVVSIMTARQRDSISSTYDTFVPSQPPGLDELIKLQEEVKMGTLSIDDALDRFNDWQRLQKGMDSVQQVMKANLFQKHI